MLSFIIQEPTTSTVSTTLTTTTTVTTSTTTSAFSSSTLSTTTSTTTSSSSTSSTTAAATTTLTTDVSSTTTASETCQCECWVYDMLYGPSPYNNLTYSEIEQALENVTKKVKISCEITASFIVSQGIILDEMTNLDIRNYLSDTKQCAKILIVKQQSYKLR